MAAQTDTNAPKRPGRARFWIAGGVALAAVLIVALALPTYSTLQPAYYERYPQLKSRMDHWRTSTHARIPCSGCHVNPGIGGMLSFSVRAIPAFYSQLIWGPKQTNLLQTPERQACQKCHTSYRQVSAGGDLLIPHRAHVEVLGLQCATCHKNLVHSLNTEGLNRPEMQTCTSQCHDGVKATNKCVKCHTRKNVPPSHKAADWLAVHSTKVKTIDCGKCHGFTPDFCKDCHSKRPASHTPTWKHDHQYRVKELGERRCLACHTREFCKNCHD